MLTIVVKNARGKWMVAEGVGVTCSDDHRAADRAARHLVQYQKTSEAKVIFGASLVLYHWLWNGGTRQAFRGGPVHAQEV